MKKVMVTVILVEAIKQDWRDRTRWEFIELPPKTTDHYGNGYYISARRTCDDYETNIDCRYMKGYSFGRAVDMFINDYYGEKRIRSVKKCWGYGDELKQDIEKTRQRLLDAMDERQRRIDDCEVEWDDCFVSEHIEADGVREANMQLRILEGDGLMEFDGIFDEEGKEVDVRHFVNKWGKPCCVGRGVFASTEEALMKKTGWTKRTVRVPVWTHFSAGGQGLCGVMNGSTVTCRWHTNMKTGEYYGYPDEY